MGREHDTRDQPEFRAEAEELLEQLGKDLQAAEIKQRQGGIHPQQVNSLFRHVHSLKGLAGMFGRDRLSALTHRLEDYLDRLRLGRIPMDVAALDLLFEAHERLETLITGEAALGEDDLRSLQQWIDSAFQERTDTPEAARGAPAPLLDAEILSSLTHYEEHRLQENLVEGKALCFLDVHLPFDSFDSELRRIIEALNSLGEVISTLPSAGPDEMVDGLGFRLLVGTREPEERLCQAVGRTTVLEWLPVTADVQPAGEGPGAAAPPSGDEPTGPEDPELAEHHEEEEARRQGQSGSSSFRVDVERLDRIMNSVGELLLSRRGIEKVAQSLQREASTQEVGRELARGARELDKKLHELQKSVIEARMVPVAQMAGRLSRLVRKLARQSGKEVVLESSGDRTELDKVMIDRLQSPLIHLIRNAIDHGLEDADERRRAGKPAAGRLKLAASQRGNSVVLTFSDDGRGLSLDAIRRAAVERRLIDADAPLDMAGACDLVFDAGFSSARGVDEMSGRGFGLDVVRREIAAINGEVWLRSVPGRGTTVEIELPITLAIIQCMLVRAAGSEFAIPVSAISETLRYRPQRTETVARRPIVRLRGEMIPLLNLRDFFHLVADDSSSPEYVVVARWGDRALALGVDALMGQHEVVIKPIGRRLEKVPGLAGATELGENRAALVVDMTSLAAEALGAGTA